MAENDTQETLTKQCNVLKEFLENLLVTFPEIQNTLHEGLKEILLGNNTSEQVTEVLEFCKTSFPPHFFDILYQKEEIFEQPCELIPSIDFSFLFKQNISENTTKVLWKYLQLLLFSFVGDFSGDSFGDASKIFEQINEDDFKNKLQETMKEMEKMFDVSGQTTDSNINLEDLPDADEMHEHISGLLDGKLGKLAKEIAEETAGELNLSDSDNVEGAFQNLLQNPTKLMSLVKNIGSKMDSKLKSGNINQEELMEEANKLMGKMNNLPGMGNIQEMLSKMGMGGLNNLNKRNMAQAASHMRQNMQQTNMKDRLKRKLEERQKLKEQETQSLQTSIKEEVKQELKWTMDANEKMEKTLRTNNSNKKKKKKKKKANK